MYFLKTFVIEDVGVTSIEYALIASLIALLIIAGATAIGLKLKNIYSNVATQI
ncbi:MAG TPA: Flp family type IVb pilin [Alphaproteobacteria bacterium]|nr:Flp family type IVb pilin [Alphaproteobacteria bacterium]